MTPAASARWRVLGVSLLAAVVWRRLYGRAFVDPYFASTPAPWLRQVHFWMPDMLASRLLRVFGFRFNIDRYGENSPYVLIAVAIEVAIWAALFYGLAILVKRVRRRAENVAAA